MLNKKAYSNIKILLLDIETAPILAHVWSLWDENVGLNQIETDWHILAWAAKWLGDPPNKAMYRDQSNAAVVENDKRILKPLWKLLNDADIVITHNGVKFDHKKINARFVHWGFKPPSSFITVDTYQIARRKFAFTSNKLEYLAQHLGTTKRKLTKRKYNGFELWKECLAGNKSAWAEMRKYNILDILVLEEIFEKLIPWLPQYNINMFMPVEESRCNVCGNYSLIKNGFRYKLKGKYQRYQCADCGASVVDSVNLLSPKKRKSLRTNEPAT